MALIAFEKLRPRLFGVAYRMMGSVADADDVLQDAWLRWQGTDRDSVRSPEARPAARASGRRAHRAGTPICG